MKSLSLKLNKDTINFFYDENTNRFPLVEKTFELRSDSDGMIRNVVRNIILTLLKIEDSKIYNYFTSYPIILYFSNLILSLKPLMLQLNKYDGKFNITKDIHDDIVDSLFYIQDILSLNIDKINRVLINCLLTQLVIPFSNIIISSKAKSIPIKNAIYFLLLIFHIIKNKEVVDIIAYLLFLEKIDENIDVLVKNNEFNEAMFDFNIILSFDKPQGFDRSEYDKEIKNFLFVQCGYCCNETKKMNDPNSSIVSKIIDLDLNGNGEINIVNNDLNWNIIHLFKQQNREDRIVLLIYLLIQTAQIKEIDQKIIAKSLILFDNNNKSDNNQIVMLDGDAEEEDNANITKKKLYFLDLLLSVSIIYIDIII